MQKISFCSTLVNRLYWSSQRAHAAHNSKPQKGYEKSILTGGRLDSMKTTERMNNCVAKRHFCRKFKLTSNKILLNSFKNSFHSKANTGKRRKWGTLTETQKPQRLRAPNANGVWLRGFELYFLISPACLHVFHNFAKISKAFTVFRSADYTAFWNTVFSISKNWAFNHLL